MTRSRKLRHLRTQRRGAHTVEVALVLPILLVLTFCGYEFGRANLVRNAASNSAYVGARKVIVSGGTAAEARTAAEDSLAEVGVTGATITVTPSVIIHTTPSVRVNVSVPFSSVTAVGGLFLSNANINGECELTRQGFN